MIRLATILIFCFLVTYAMAYMAIQNLGDTPVISASTIQMPELVACSCDSAYRCMSDSQYMQLVAVFEQESDPFIPNCEGCS